MTEQASPPRRRVRVQDVAQLAVTVIECYATVEIVWYTLNGQHLHEALAEYITPAWERAKFNAQVMDTLRMIRRLPEGGP